MKYPRLKPEDDLRRKLMPNDIVKIRKMWREGRFSIQDIADVCHVSKELIKYWTNNSFKKRVLEKARMLRRDKNDEDRKKRELLRKIEKYHAYPCIKKYSAEKHRMQYWMKKQLLTK